jgi:hypothetical protein
MPLLARMGREMRGALRSFGYDLRQSRRFRRVSLLAALAITGGAVGTALLVNSPVPEMIGLDADDQDGTGITGNWFRPGAGTQGQDAESEPENAATGGTAPRSPVPTTEPAGRAPAPPTPSVF